MSIELLQTLSKVFFAISGVLLATSVALFFLLEIKKVVGDVTGSTARKAIENIRQQNEQTGNKAYKPSPVNKSRGKVTDKISKSGHLIRNTVKSDISVGTSDLGEPPQSPAASETTVLAENMPGVVNDTTVLNQPVSVVFSIDFEIGFCGSAEIIV